ncbi:MAG: glycerol-3-phosphate dehydrogenase/oxidase [Bacteroidia bacterium]|nr:glycerol-3-phosphate dehydrogenase/oxidase [Bacteroidia bacterium]
MALNSLHREQIIEALQEENFDLLVIGGGITGAGIALDAASRGLKTALVEMQDYAAGTSSRSTKLIHGGLRYLKNYEFGLVREVGRERAILHRNAPHIVLAEPMVLPLITGGTFSRGATSLGLWLYDRLAGVKKAERRKMLNTKAALEKEPMLRRDGLKGAGYYWEYRTDDARLTVEILKTAAANGVKILNYARVTELNYSEEGHQLISVKVKDGLSDREFQVKATHFVNAAGPWVDTLRTQDKSLSEKRLHHTKGVHLVFPHARLPLKQSVYFDVPGGRMIFAIPRDNTTYVGTTDTNFSGRLENPGVTQDDVEYLLKGANFMFPDARLEEKDILSSWSGIRPLIHEEGKSPSELSRKDEIFLSPSGLVTIAGGKLTGYRKMAERTVDVIMKRISSASERPNVVCQTEKLTLSGGDLEGAAGVAQKGEELAARLEEAGLDSANGPIWANRYGSNASLVADLAIEMLGTALSPAHAAILGELQYCLENEGVCTPSDFLVRRTGKLWFDRESIGPFLPDVLDFLADKFSWEPEEKQARRSEFMEEFSGVLKFD